jgi:hypothetical protein
VRRLYLASLGNINRREKLVSKRKRPASGSRRLELQLSLPLNSHQKRPRLGPCYDDLCLLRQGNPLPIFKTRRRTYLTFNLDRNSHVALAWLCLGGTHDPELGERCWHGCVLPAKATAAVLRSEFATYGRQPASCWCGRRASGGVGVGAS